MKFGKMSSLRIQTIDQPADYTIPIAAERYYAHDVGSSERFSRSNKTRSSYNIISTRRGGDARKKKTPFFLYKEKKQYVKGTHGSLLILYLMRSSYFLLGILRVLEGLYRLRCCIRPSISALAVPLPLYVLAVYTCHLDHR